MVSIAKLFRKQKSIRSSLLRWQLLSNVHESLHHRFQWKKNEEIDKFILKIVNEGQGNVSVMIDSWSQIFIKNVFNCMESQKEDRRER
jgi:hypothetical protein